MKYILPALTRYWRPRGQKVVLDVDDGEAPGPAEHVPGQAGQLVVAEVESDQLGAPAESLRVQIGEPVVRQRQRVETGETCREKFN